PAFIAAWADFRIKADIMATGAIQQLGIDKQFGFGPDLTQKQRLTPTAVAEYHIGGIVVLIPQRPAGARGQPAAIGHLTEGPAQHGGQFQVGRRLVAHNLDRRSSLVLFIRQGQHMMATRRQRRRKVQKLARKVLMDEQDFHASVLRKAASIRQRVYSLCGLSNTASVVPCSITSPARMTMI